MDFITNSPEETEAVGAALGKILQPGTILAYRGDLGAGKTAFTRGLARGLGYCEPVTSPTYTIVNEYLGGRLPLLHACHITIIYNRYAHGIVHLIESIHVHLALVHLSAYAWVDGKVLEAGGVQHVGYILPLILALKTQSHLCRKADLRPSLHLFQQSGNAHGMWQYAASTHQLCLHGGRAAHIHVHLSVSQFLYCIRQAVELVRVRTDDLRYQVQSLVILRKDILDVLVAYASLLPSDEGRIIRIHTTAMSCMNPSVFKIRVSLQRGKVNLHACIFLYAKIGLSVHNAK